MSTPPKFPSYEELQDATPEDAVYTRVGAPKKNKENSKPNTSQPDTLKMLYAEYTNAYNSNYSYEEFRKKLEDENSRKILYNELNAVYDLKSKSFDEFNARLDKFTNPDIDSAMVGDNINIPDSDKEYQDSPEPISIDEIDIENDDPSALLSSQVESNKNEQEFKDWYAAAHQMYGLDPDPDHPDHHYDYKAAWRANVVPEKYTNENGEEEYHWPSQFKGDNHPKRWMRVETDGEEYVADTKNGNGFKISEMENLLSNEYGLTSEEIAEWKNILGDNNMIEADEYLTKLMQSKMMPDYEGKPLLTRSLHDIGNTFTSIVMGIGGMASYFVNVGGPGLAAQAKTGVDLWENGELPTMESWMEDWMKHNQPQTAGGEKVLMALGLPFQLYSDNIVTPAAEWMDENTEGTLWANATEGGLNMLPFLSIAKGKYNKVQKLKTGVNPSMWSKMTKIHNIINKEFPKVTIEFSKLRNIAKNMNKKEYNKFVDKMSKSLGMEKSEFLKHMKNGGKKEVNFMSYIETFDRPWFYNLKSKVGIKSDYHLGIRLSLKEKIKVKNNGIVVENEVLLPKGKDARKVTKAQYQNHTNQIMIGENLSQSPSISTKPNAIIPPKLTPEQLVTAGKETTVPPSIVEQAKIRIQERQQKAELDAKTKQKNIIEEQIDLEEVATGKPSKLRDVSKSIDKDIKKLETPKPKVVAAKKPITKTQANIADKAVKDKPIIVKEKPKSSKELDNYSSNLKPPKRPSAKNNEIVVVDIAKADKLFSKDKGYYFEKGKYSSRGNVSENIAKNKDMSAPIASIVGKGDKQFLSFTDGRHRFSQLRDAGASKISLSMTPEMAVKARELGLTAKGKDIKTVTPKVESSPVPLKSDGWSKVKPKDGKNEPIHGRKFKDNEFFIQKKPTGSGGKMEIHQVDLNGKSLGVVGKNHNQAYNKIKSNIKSLEPKKKAYSQKLIDATKTKKAYSDNPELNKIYKTINEVIDPKIKEIKANKNLTKEQKRRLVQIQENKRSQLKLDEKHIKRDAIDKDLKEIEHSKSVQKSFDVTTARIKELKKEQIQYEKRFGSPNLDKKYEMIRLKKDLKELESIMKDLKKYKEQPMIMSSIIPGLPELITGIGNYIKRKSAKVLSRDEINYIKTTIEKAKKFRESKKPIPKDVKDTSKPSLVINKLKKGIFSEPEAYALEFEKALKDVNAGKTVAFLKAENITKPLYEFIKDNKIKPERMRTLLDAIEDGILISKGNGKYEISQQKLMDYPSITPKEIQLIQSYRTLMDDGFNLALKEGVINDDVFLSNYVSHLTDGGKSRNVDYQALAKKFHTKPSFTNKRYYETLKELEAAGHIINTDMVYHIQQYYNSLYKAIADKRFVDYLSKAETADGLPLLSHHKGFLDIKSDLGFKYKEMEIKGLGRWYARLDNKGKPILVNNDIVYVHPEIYPGLKSYLKQGLSTQLKHRPFGKVYLGIKRAQKRLVMMNPLFHGINIASDVFVEASFNPSKGLKWLFGKEDGTAGLLKLNNKNSIKEFQAECGLNLGYVSQVSENMRLKFKDNFQDLNAPMPKDLKGKSKRYMQLMKKYSGIDALDKIMWEGIVGNSATNMHLSKTMSILMKQGYFDKSGKQLKTIPNKVLLDAGKTAADYTNNNLGTLPDIVFSETGGLVMDLALFAKNWTAGWTRQLMTYPTNLPFGKGGKLVRGGKINIGGYSFNPLPRFLQWKGQTKSEYDWTRDAVRKHGIKAVTALLIGNELISQIRQTFKEENEGSDWLTLGGNRYISLLQPGLKLKNRLQVDLGLTDKTRPSNKLFATNPMFKYMRDIMLMFQGLEDIGEHLKGKSDPLMRNFTAILSNRDYIKGTKIRHPGATWTEQAQDVFSFLAHRMTPLGQWKPEDGYVFNQIRAWSALTGFHAASVNPDITEALDISFQMMARKDYEKTNIDNQIKEAIFTGNWFGTQDENGNILTKGVADLLAEHPEHYASQIKILQNLQQKHHNYLGYTFALKSKQERIAFVNKIVDEFGIEYWQNLNEKFDLGLFLEKKEK